MAISSRNSSFFFFQKIRGINQITGSSSPRKAIIVHIADFEWIKDHEKCSLKKGDEVWQKEVTNFEEWKEILN